MMGNSDHSTTYMREGGDDGELRPLHYIYVGSIKSSLIMIPASSNRNQETEKGGAIEALAAPGAANTGELHFSETKSSFAIHHTSP